MSVMDNLLFSAADVYDFTKNYLSHSGKLYLGRNDWLSTICDELQKEVEAAETRENRLLSSLGYNNFKEFQEAINEAQETYSGLANRALRKNQDTGTLLRGSLQLTSAGATSRQVAEALLIKLNNENDPLGAEFKAYVGEMGIAAAEDKIVEFLMQHIGTNVNDKFIISKNKKRSGKIKKSQLTGTLENLVKYMKKSLKPEDEKRTKANRDIYRDTSTLDLKSYKGDITYAFELNNDLNLLTCEATIDIRYTNGKIKQINYPYFEPNNPDYSPKSPTWENWIKTIQQVCRSNQVNGTRIRKIMEKLKPEFFKANSFEEVIGKLGELQATLIFYSVAKKNENIKGIKPIGQLNEPIDLIIATNKEYFGIQVKNLNFVNNSIYRLTGSNNLNYFVDEEGMDGFCNLLLTRYFNQYARIPQGNIENYEHYKDFYKENYESTNFKNLLSAMAVGRMDLFFDKAAKEEFRKKFIQTGKDFSGKNAFWLFEGKNLVPFSRIYKVLKIRLDEYSKKLIDSGLKAEAGPWKNTFRVQPTPLEEYNGPRWNYEYGIYRENPSEAPVTVQEVLKKISISSYLNISLKEIYDETFLEIKKGLKT